MTEAEFIDLVRTNPVNAAILDRLPSLHLPDAWLVSGSLFQTIWNVLTGRETGYGIKDYDIFYFDRDTSWEAEDAVIGRCVDAFADLDAEVEVRNQSRVHLWYRQKFGMPYPPLKDACEGIDRFLALACKVGISGDGQGRIYAPDGFDDIEKMIIRPNPTPNLSPVRYAEKAERWRSRWPELKVLPA